MKYNNDMLSGPDGAFFKFIMAALFGLLVSLAIGFIAAWLLMDSFFATPWVHILWIIPLVWGVLGIFWFDQMLELGKKIIEYLFGIDS
jgi:hypothetical protein